MSNQVLPKFITETDEYRSVETGFHVSDVEYIKSILAHHERDIYPQYGYFCESDFRKISEKARKLFLESVLKENPKLVSKEDITFSWEEVVRDFLKTYWGFKKTQERVGESYLPQVYKYTSPQDIPQKPVPPPNYWDTFFYIWSALQTLIVTKCLILIYGNELAKDDTFGNRIFFGIVMILSFGSLFLFAWLRRKKKYT